MPRTLLLGILFLVATTAYAHPHVFITNRSFIVFEGATLVRMNLEWTFDELFSSTIITDFDANKNGRFEAGEVSELKIGAFDNLARFHYFTSIVLDGKPQTLHAIEDFKPSISGGKLIYRFSIPIGVVVKQGETRNLGITLYDDSYYSAFAKMGAENVILSKAEGVECRVSIDKESVKASWPGQFMPDRIVLKLRGVPKP
jgi:ABC-type uncharacterized transport system substrate-binding protein